MAGQECAIEGEIGDYTLVSVPPTISHQAAKVLEENLKSELGKPVMIFTHNVQFLRVTKMTPKDVNKVLKEVEESQAAAQQAAIQPAPTDTK